MTPTRREFIKSVGVAIAALMAVRCKTPFKSAGDTPRDHLRNCWQQMDWLAEEARDWDHYERGEKARDQLVADHRAALNDLMAAGDLGAAAADQVQTAFSAAAYHVWRANCGMTCYEPMPGPDYTPTSSTQLAQQAEILAEMAESGDVNQGTVAQAQTAIERDVAFLNLSDEETQALYDRLMETTSGTYSYPAFDELDLEITPEAAAAARFLVDLLLGETE